MMVGITPAAQMQVAEMKVQGTMQALALIMICTVTSRCRIQDIVT